MNYGRLFGLLAIISFLTVSPSVEKIQAQPVDIGLSAGMNLSSHQHNFVFSEGDIMMNLDPMVKTGFNTGMLIRKNLNPAWRLQAEPSLTMMGARYEESFMLRGFEFQTESKTNLLFFHLPLVVQLSTVLPEKTVYGTPFRQTTYHISGGLFGGYLLNAQFSGTNTGEPTGVEFEGDFSNDVTHQYSSFEFGALLGVGLEHGSTSKFGVEARALHSWDATHGAFDPQNMAISMAVYYLF